VKVPKSFCQAPRMSRKIAGYPRWLTLSKDRTSFSLLPERAVLIRNIFQMSCSGLGCYTIAKHLNDQKVPAFGTSGRWDQSTIDKMLRNRAVIGELQPTSYTSKAQRASYDEPPVPAFYPAAIDQELFDATQVARKKNGKTARGRKGHHVTNLFGKLVKCLHCGAPVRFHSNGRRKSMICSTVLNAGPCYRYCWSYPDFETAFLEAILGLDGKEPHSRRFIDIIRSSPDAAHTYYPRIEISALLRDSVQFLGMAAAGNELGLPLASGRITRDQPGRFLEIQFRGGSRHRSTIRN
jgi:hypothetical protein